MTTTLYHPRPERWPQFTLRGLLIAVTLTALLMPQLLAEYRRWEAEQERLEFKREMVRAIKDMYRGSGFEPYIELDD